MSIVSDSARGRTGTAGGGRRRAVTRERLLDAARDLLAREGIHGASVEHICEAAGFSRGAFYSNFTSKDELVLALLEREFADLLARLQEAVAIGVESGGDEVETLATIMDRFMDLQPPNRDFLLLHSEFQLRGLRGDTGGQEYKETWQRVIDEVLAIVERALADVGLRLTIAPRAAGAILLGTYTAELGNAVLEDRAMDRDLMRVTLPAMLLSATESVA